MEEWMDVCIHNPPYSPLSLAKQDLAVTPAKSSPWPEPLNYPTQHPPQPVPLSTDGEVFTLLLCWTINWQETKTRFFEIFLASVIILIWFALSKPYAALSQLRDKNLIFGIRFPYIQRQLDLGG